MKLLIDTKWFAAIKDLAPKKRQEVIEAILDYPNKESDTHLWQNVIKPDLERGAIAYFNKINHLKQNNPQKSAKKITGTESGTDTGTESKVIERNINNSRIDLSLLDTTRTHAREKTVEEILNEAARNLSPNRATSHLITPDFVFPKNPYFDAYRKELPTATSRTEQWLRRSNMVGKQVSEIKLGQIIQKFATRK